MPTPNAEAADTQTLGAGIREFWLHKEWSQPQRADRLGLRQKQISSHERDVNVPAGEIFVNLAKTFGLSLAYLAQPTPYSSPRITIAEPEMFEKFQIGNQHDYDERALVKNILNLYITRHRFCEFTNEGMPGLNLAATGLTRAGRLRSIVERSDIYTVNPRDRR